MQKIQKHERGQMEGYLTEEKTKGAKNYIN